MNKSKQNDRNFLLVLGAGSSKPYGYPTSQELATKIAEELYTERDYSEPVTRLAHFLHYESEKLDLDDIDAEIERLTSPGDRRKSLEQTYKSSLLKAITTYEKDSILHPGGYVERFVDLEKDWIFKLACLMRDLEMSPEQLKVLTLNYDNVFEHVFHAHTDYLGLSNLGPGLIRITHMYGDVRSIEDPKYKYEQYGKPYENFDLGQSMFTARAEELAEQKSEAPISFDYSEVTDVIFFGLNFENKRNMDLILKVCTNLNLGIEAELHIFGFVHDPSSYKKYLGELRTSFTKMDSPFYSRFKYINHIDSVVELVGKNGQPEHRLFGYSESVELLLQNAFTGTNTKIYDW